MRRVIGTLADPDTIRCVAEAGLHAASPMRRSILDAVYSVTG